MRKFAYVLKVEVVGETDAKFKNLKSASRCTTQTSDKLSVATTTRVEVLVLLNGSHGATAVFTIISYYDEDKMVGSLQSL